jgi:excisionase family DNA binding protein
MQTPQELERWLSVEEIAFHLGVSKESIYRWTENGKMPAHKLGRQWKFKASEVDGWMKSGAATASSQEVLNHFSQVEKDEI